MISHIHHINFVVRNLEQAVNNYEQLLGLKGFIYDELSGRSVKTARIMVGQSWLVLVQPTDETGIPAKHLEQFGEGFFLLSFGTDDIQTHLEKLQDQGFDMTLSKTRKGLENWLVADLPNASSCGAQLQLTQETV